MDSSRIGFILISVFMWKEVLSDCIIASESTTNTRERTLLKQLEPLKGHKFTADDQPASGLPLYSYQLSICSDVAKGGYVGLIQINKNNNKTYAIGRYNETQVMGGIGWILLKYKHGDQYHHVCSSESNVTSNFQYRQAHIMITCDEAELDGQLKVIEENTDQNEECYYLFQLNSKVSCPEEHGLSSGSIFCIIFFTVAGIYLIIGFLYQRLIVGAKGLEQIPNYAFWKDFGKLQADGCDFMCRCGERQESKMYRGIDDQLLNEDERDDRDDRLLPM